MQEPAILEFDQRGAVAQKCSSDAVKEKKRHSALEHSVFFSITQ